MWLKHWIRIYTFCEKRCGALKQMHGGNQWRWVHYLHELWAPVGLFIMPSAERLRLHLAGGCKINYVTDWICNVAGKHQQILVQSGVFKCISLISDLKHHPTQNKNRCSGTLCLHQDVRDWRFKWIWLRTQEAPHPRRGPSFRNGYWTKYPPVHVLSPCHLSCTFTLWTQISRSWCSKT